MLIFHFIFDLRSSKLILKTVFIIGITCTFDNRASALFNARLEKITKYQCLVDYFNAKGYFCEVLPFIVGSLGSWYSGIIKLSVNWISTGATYQK